MFSVIIPLYNKASYIERAIKSVLDQSFADFEVIVIDDGSTDDSPAKLKCFTDPRLRLIPQPNLGVSTARNNGVKEARFDYVAFLDSDDWWHSNFLNEMKNLITGFPLAGMYGSGYYIVKNGRSIQANIGLDDDFQIGYINYFSVYSRTFWVPVNCSFVVVRKDIFEAQGGFSASLRFGEDVDLWVRIALRNKVGYVRKNLAYSDQDVDVSARALGMGRYWQKKEHVIFNLAYLQEEENVNQELKFLLDGLRVRSLTGFYLKSWHSDEVQAILAKIDFNKQPFFYRFIYQWPLLLVKTYFEAKQLGSFIKQAFLRIAYNRQASGMLD
ncbi:hypothetical protein DYBT9275_02273 [Dyadobacter sp. CECT 9275]|uniref:Glycosyltransferase 2-like domain-containing protein n=1 Tax=Dyadobacter helix TaxID=2822344 RepID=A0A916JDT1_9BACT|nr:glycosyltransferase [Dyadobacter sp. CECT 9275]CAG4999658.1 hypothetical protein DYBT9275_02273 [Dyadobacter sp. CECT 9275]